MVRSGVPINLNSPWSGGLKRGSPIVGLDGCVHRYLGQDILKYPAECAHFMGKLEWYRESTTFRLFIEAEGFFAFNEKIR
jgi:hypothetical protein